MIKRSTFLKLYQVLLQKRSLVFTVAEPFLKLSAILYAGDNVFCACCEGQFKKFLPFGANRRENAICPGCLSLERHRLLWLYLKQKTNLFSESLKVLHVAPEYVIGRKLMSLKNISYLTGDIVPMQAMVQMDITDINYEDNSFDVILCSHVLEHIPDDRRAMTELCRVLKVGGWAILQVPIDSQLENTLEGASTLTSEEREKLFGHHDHVRMYGRDYAAKLEQAGFTVKIDSYGKSLGIELTNKWGLLPDEDIYFCTKTEN